MQAADGLSLDAQQAAIEQYCQAQGYKLVAIYKDVLSGAKDQRPGLKEALGRLERGVDVLVHEGEDVGLLHGDDVVGVDGLGLDAATMLHVHVTLFSYVRGIAINIEWESEAEASSGLTEEEWMDAHSPALEAIARHRVTYAVLGVWLVYAVVRLIGEI